LTQDRYSDKRIRGGRWDIYLFWVFRVFLKIFFPIEVEKKGGWRRRMKGKRVFEGGGRTKDQRERRTPQKNPQDGPTRQKKCSSFGWNFSYIFWFMGRAKPIKASPWLL
jgi:hypothetical protein